MAGQTPAWWCCPMAPLAQAVAATTGTPAAAQRSPGDSRHTGDGDRQKKPGRPGLCPEAPVFGVLG